MDSSPSPFWEEALEVDDSDLHSLPPLRPCNHQPQPLHSSSPFRPIPGPAGVVQAAKLRKAHRSHHDPSMSTQDYIRRAPEDDADFKRNPWLSAMEFISVFYCAVPTAPLADVKNFLKNGKLGQVLAFIKSAAPNGLGDLLVTLKDPTGTISGTIHHKVLIDGEFGKDISVGSVLILHKVSVFSPSRSAHYLNITVRNLVKVFREDSEPSLKQTVHRCKIQDAAVYGSDFGVGVGGDTVAEEAQVKANPNLWSKLSKAKEADVTEVCDKVKGRDASQLPHWTDEQLYELLDDDLSLYR